MSPGLGHKQRMFATLTALELVLGIDNVIFISILVEKLPVEKREIARRIGLFAAMFMRIVLLMMLDQVVLWQQLKLPVLPYLFGQLAL